MVKNFPSPFSFFQEKFIWFQIVRLYGKDKLDEDAISLMNSCEPIANNQMFRKIVLGIKQSAGGAVAAGSSQQCLPADEPVHRHVFTNVPNDKINQKLYLLFTKKVQCAEMGLEAWTQMVESPYEARIRMM